MTRIHYGMSIWGLDGGFWYGGYRLRIKAPSWKDREFARHAGYAGKKGSCKDQNENLNMGINKYIGSYGEASLGSGIQFELVSTSTLYACAGDGGLGWGKQKKRGGGGGRTGQLVFDDKRKDNEIKKTHKVTRTISIELIFLAFHRGRLR